MSAEILRIHPDEPQPDRIDYVVSCLRKGDIVAIPTDTFYGLAVDPVNLRAVEHIYQLKSRQKHKPLSLLISGLSQAYELARDSDPMSFDLRLADKFWPGPLTIIVRAGSPRLPLRSTANTGNVALRVPDAAIARSVVEKFGLPITATSANLQGSTECYRMLIALRDQIGDRISADCRWRADRALTADDHCRPLSRPGPLDDSPERGAIPYSRNRDGARAVGGCSHEHAPETALRLSTAACSPCAAGGCAPHPARSRRSGLPLP